MVKVSAPALSLDASGSVGGTIVFSKWKGRNYVRSLVKPANPKSGGQVGMRAGFRFLSQIWAALSAGNQATWEDRAETTSISPFNAFMSYNQTRLRNFLGLTKEDPAADSASTATAGAGSASAGVRSITVTQAITVAGNAWAVAFYRATSTGFATALTNLVRIIPIDGTNDVVFVDTPLAAGHYYYNMRLITVDGTLDAEIGEVDDTVT